MAKLNLTARHKAYEMALNDHDLNPVLCLGSPGTGKTHMAVGKAVDWMKHSNKHNVVVVRPNVSFADTLGYTKGSTREKLSGWIRPIEKCFIEHGFNLNMQECAEKNGNLEYVALEEIQGLSWHNSFVILDECENMSFSQLKVFMTRIGNYSKVVLCGDIAQTSPKFKNSGLREFVAMCETLDMPIHIIKMTSDDILRGDITKKFLIGFEKWENMKEGKNI